MVAGLIDALTVASTDDRVRVIVLDGAGDHFCGGADIVARNRADDDGAEAAGRGRRHPAPAAHAGAPAHPARCCEIQVPVVCKVRGFAAGIGLSLALAADFTIAADDATFWEPFARARASRPTAARRGCCRAGSARCARGELLLLGTRALGAEAAAWGAIHAAVPADELDAAVDELVAHARVGPDRHARAHEVAAARRARRVARPAAAQRGVRAGAVVAHRATSARAWRRSASVARRASRAR